MKVYLPSKRLRNTRWSVKLARKARLEKNPFRRRRFLRLRVWLIWIEEVNIYWNLYDFRQLCLTQPKYYTCRAVIGRHYKSLNRLMEVLQLLKHIRPFWHSKSPKWDEWNWPWHYRPGRPNVELDGDPILSPSVERISRNNIRVDLQYFRYYFKNSADPFFIWSFRRRRNFNQINYLRRRKNYWPLYLLCRFRRKGHLRLKKRLIYAGWRKHTNVAWPSLPSNNFLIGKHRQSRLRLKRLLGVPLLNSRYYPRRTRLFFRLAFVRQRRNFWGIFYKFNSSQVKFVRSAGQLPDTKGSRRGRTYPMIILMAEFGRRLKELLPVRGQPILRRRRRRRRRKILRHNRKLDFFINLKNYQPNRYWREGLSLFFEPLNLVGYHVVVNFICPRPHNGLRRAKQRR